MNQGVFRKLLPHLVAVLIFLAIAVIYCSPVLQGESLAQHDITHWKGAIQQSLEYEETHGEKPLWTNAVFSGMPAFQIGYTANNTIPWWVHNIMTLWLPMPIQFFFLASICFYILMVVLRIRPVVGILGSLAFAYATYNPVIITVGHVTKMWSMAYMPALLASVILVYEKKYWLGAAFTALFTAVIIAMNHPQIDYYLFLVIGIMTIFYAIRWIRSKEWKHFVLALSITIVSAAIGLMTNAVTFLSTLEYQKATIRGGGSALSDTTGAEQSNTGLTKDYAFSYSMEIAEPLVMLVPRIYGGSSDHLEMAEEKSKTIEEIRNMPQQTQQVFFQQFSFLLGQTEDQELYAKMYWGGIGGTSGPPYVGAIICFLAILAMFVLNGKHKWWAFTAIMLSIVMSWGHYFSDFNSLLFDYLPLYNKFRAPSMILVIPQLLLPMLAALGVSRMAEVSDSKTILPLFKKGLIATGIVFAVLLVLYISFEYLSQGNKDILKQIREMNQPQLLALVDSFFDALKEDRKSLMLGSIFRSLGFIAVAVVTLFLMLRRTIKPLAAVIILTVFAFIDVMVINANYLNKDSYTEETAEETAFAKTAHDDQILADTSFFRVYNVGNYTAGGDRFSENITSYLYNSVGGYHPAKLIIYQDLIEQQLAKGNEKVLDMLNTKYLIQKDEVGLTQGSQLRTTALGPAWLVKHIRFVKDAREEMAALDNFTPRDTAIVQEKYRSSIPFMPQADSAGSIRLVKNDNDIVTYTFTAASNQFAVFSEIYYEDGWKAFIDGKPSPIVKVNYVLRGLAVPAGAHNIEFRFEPPGYLRGRSITTIFTIALLALVAAGIFMEWRRRKRGRPAEV